MKFIRSATIDIIAVSGMGLVSYGAWCIYQPAAFIIGGMFALGTALALARSSGS